MVAALVVAGELDAQHVLVVEQHDDRPLGAGDLDAAVDDVADDVVDLTLEFTAAIVSSRIARASCRRRRRP